MKRETTLPAWCPGHGMTAFDNSRNYIGEQVEAFVVYQKHRDSNLLTVTNFNSILADLRTLAEKTGAPDSVTVREFGHWAVGHIEQIHIAPDAPRAVFDLAENIQDQLADYPVYNESAFSDAEWSAAADYWEQLSPREKVEHAMRERERCHWLASESVWRFGRFTFHQLANDGGEIAESVYERVRCYATE